MQKPSLLWVTPKWPLPAEDGQRIATVNLLQFAGPAFQTDLISFLNRDEKPNVEFIRKNFGIRKVLLLPAEKSFTVKTIWCALKSLFSSRALPITLLRFRKRQQYDAARTWILSHGPWDAVVFDTLHSAALFLDAAELPRQLIGKKFFYRAHNVESTLWEMAAARSRAWGFLFRAQARCMRAFERSLIRYCDATLAVSMDDLQQLRNLETEASFSCIPIGMEFSRAAWPTKNSSEEKRKNKLLFFGRLDWPPNRDGLHWFLGQVWPTAILENPELELVIAGSGNGSWLEAFRGQAGITILGRVADPLALYESASAVVLPIFYGSGTRVKAIEAARFERLILSTELGVQGLGLRGGESYLRAEDKTEWLRLLAGLPTVDSHPIVEKAHAALCEKFALEAVGANFIALLKDSLPPGR